MALSLDEKQSSVKDESSQQIESSLSPIYKRPKEDKSCRNEQSGVCIEDLLRKYISEKDPGIQWKTMRYLIQWKRVSGNELNVHQKASFDEHSKCRITIPREHMNDHLTTFIRYCAIYKWLFS